MARQLGAGRIPAYVLSIVARVRESTGYPVFLTEEEGLGYDSLAAMAGSHQPYHRLSYTPGYRQFAPHFLVNACWKILRVWAEPEAERLVPVKARQGGLPGTDYLDLSRRLIDLPPEAPDELSTFLYDGVVREVTSMPMDLRVERELHRDLPEHRPAQWRYLRRQLDDLEPHFAPGVAAFAPERVYAATTAMNVVLAEEAGEIIGRRPSRRIRESPHREKGSRLRDILRSLAEPGYRGDRLITDAWARELGVQGWFEWTPLAEVR